MTFIFFLVKNTLLGLLFLAFACNKYGVRMLTERVCILSRFYRNGQKRFSSLLRGLCSRFVLQNNRQAKLAISEMTQDCFRTASIYKHEYMLLTSGQYFIGPLHQISLGVCSLKLVTFSRCLGVQLDHELKWDNHVNLLIKSYTKK